MVRARELGIPVLSEAAFIRCFLNVDEFDDMIDDETLYYEAWEIVYGDVLEFVVENGTQPVIMQVWKDGKWQSHPKPENKRKHRVCDFSTGEEVSID